MTTKTEYADLLVKHDEVLRRACAGDAVLGELDEAWAGLSEVDVMEMRYLAPEVIIERYATRKT